MKLLSIVFDNLCIINIVFSTTIKSLFLNNYLDYKKLYDSHYNSNMTDKNIAKWISGGINFAINTEIYNKNIIDYKDI